MRTNKILIIPVFLSLLFFWNSVSYSQNEQYQTYKLFDEIVGRESTGLFNGVEYTEEHRTINEKHKFFLSRDFISGFLVYDHQPYPEVEMKYNIHEQLLLVRAKNEVGISIMQLINDKIDSFVIADHLFENLKPSGSDPNDIAGFKEVLFRNNLLSLYKEYSQQLNQRRDEKLVYYEFKNELNDYLLFYNNKYYRIGSRRDLNNIFPEQKRAIRNFYKSNRQLLKSNPDIFMVLLFEDITPILDRENLLLK